jgi:hypothetical protein
LVSCSTFLASWDSAGRHVSHRVMQNQLRHFVWLPITNLAAFVEPLWPSCLDACKPICSLTMVCLPYTTIATSSSYRGRAATICRCSPPVAIEAGESVMRHRRSPLVAAKDGESVALHHARLILKEICPRGNNNIVIIIFLVHDNVYTPC